MVGRHPKKIRPQYAEPVTEGPANGATARFTRLPCQSRTKCNYPVEVRRPEARRTAPPTWPSPSPSHDPRRLEPQHPHGASPFGVAFGLRFLCRFRTGEHATTTAITGQPPPPPEPKLGFSSPPSARRTRSEATALAHSCKAIYAEASILRVIWPLARFSGLSFLQELSSASSRASATARSRLPSDPWSRATQLL